MLVYCVSDQAKPNGDHEVHNIGCSYLPGQQHQVRLGAFASCQLAVAEAKQYFPQANGCIHCSKECHT